ncbi:cytochrome P450 [Artemisia annua]|uniref:Cytochrome P450 n=1 Tax=Artemisia annua TaxID=35608 RepID=A0A2U1M434_ARTAN|nr:cytochrome P450 [Artemisia annua]
MLIDFLKHVLPHHKRQQTAVSYDDAATCIAFQKAIDEVQQHGEEMLMQNMKLKEEKLKVKKDLFMSLSDSLKQNHALLVSNKVYRDLLDEYRKKEKDLSGRCEEMSNALQWRESELNAKEYDLNDVRSENHDTRGKYAAHKLGVFEQVDQEPGIVSLVFITPYLRMVALLLVVPMRFRIMVRTRTATHDSDERYHLSIQDIIDECKTFYVSGDATTSLLLSWAVLLLSIHKEWQEKARDEVFELFGKEHPRSDGMGKLKMIGMIINETLRLYPPGIAVIRKNEREVKFRNLTIPANVNLHIPVLALHHDRKIWGEDAHLFKPERFLEGISKATKNNPSAYMPFGFGPRNCVGSNFAINTAKVTLAMILQRYRFIPSPSYIHSPVHVVLLIPKNGLQVMLHAL